MTRRILLVCGLASTLLYIVTDSVGALSYPGYDYTSQAISEMSAVGATTAGLLAPFYLRGCGAEPVQPAGCGSPPPA
jgi:hypothetical protein